MNPSKIGYVGLGHIGGSVAKTIHRIHPDIEQIAYDTCRESLEKALADGVITYASTGIDDGFADCDIIYLCAPVLDNNDYVEKFNEIVTGDMLLTDVGSVKTGIHKNIEKFPNLMKHFIGGHPMCGTEHVGYDVSTEYMLENAYYLLTPADVDEQMVKDFKDFTASIGAIPMVLDYKKHDFSVTSISHLPHIISATLVNLVKNIDDEQETLKTIAAGGFRDITRISSSDPVMWENICMANRDQLLELVDIYIAALNKSRDIVARSERSELNSFFSNAKEYRDSFNFNQRGAIHKVYQLFLDIIDEAGEIATVATVLAANAISIKNIGIIHNREFQEGVLQVEFYDQDAYDRAKKLLDRHHYTYHENK